jgi:phosphatidate phosphatase LPIN
MNYIRGAVNAISAPYQYYKELPPINPSTLTGAIDVIVIQRPGSGGKTELACSPFHVRFGKWQVLRPSDKQVRSICYLLNPANVHRHIWPLQVNVSVNGQQIPYNMKIGDAGEAFFVFETDEDVPADLITSPILHPTRPEAEAAGAQTDAATGRFGAKEDHPPDGTGSSEITLEPASIKTPEQEVQREYQEPEFLDLNDIGEGQQEGQREEPPRDINLTPKQEFHQPSFLRHSTSRSTIQQRRRPIDEAPNSSFGLPSPPNSRSLTPEIDEQDKRVDEALKNLSEETKPPEVEYHHGKKLISTDRAESDILLS